MISHEKRQFLKVISGGLHILMSCSYKADDIGIDPEDGIEETISEKMIVLANTIANGERYWFDDGRFNNYVDVAFSHLKVVCCFWHLLSYTTSRCTFLFSIILDVRQRF